MGRMCRTALADGDGAGGRVDGAESKPQADRKIIGEYSKGMRKRVAMAASLIPSSRAVSDGRAVRGVDAVARDEGHSDGPGEGARYLPTTHVLEVVERLCDWVAIINEGRIDERSAERTRAGGESLEDAFARLVGAETQTGRLEEGDQRSARSAEYAEGRRGRVFASSRPIVVRTVGGGMRGDSSGIGGFRREARCNTLPLGAGGAPVLAGDADLRP